MHNISLPNAALLLILMAALLLSLVVALFVGRDRSRDDGRPGQKRGKVWTKEERDRERRKQRIIAGGCPPHSPEYDKSVDETYCSVCLERLPNE